MAIFKSKSVTLPIIGILRNFSGMFLLSIEIFLIGGNEGLSKLTHPSVYPLDIKAGCTPDKTSHNVTTLLLLFR